ncbi:MAG: hypothetical protein LAP87_09890 [Acidobacteriia bacterium]|nr:hypothetical protein [Terriglobia bacterium]
MIETGIVKILVEAAVKIGMHFKDRIEEKQMGSKADELRRSRNANFFSPASGSGTPGIPLKVATPA